MAKTIQVRKVQFAAKDDPSELYDCVRGLARMADREKAFVAAFGEREQFLKKEVKRRR